MGVAISEPEQNLAPVGLFESLVTHLNGNDGCLETVQTISGSAKVHLTAIKMETEPVRLDAVHYLYEPQSMQPDHLIFFVEDGSVKVATLLIHSDLVYLENVLPFDSLFLDEADLVKILQYYEDESEDLAATLVKVKKRFKEIMGG